MSRSRHARRAARTVLIACGLATALAVPANAAVVNVAGGTTSLKLDPATATALTGLGVSVNKVGAARPIAGGLAFGITGGVVDPATAAGIINHRGGLQLRKGRTAVNLTDFRVNTRTGSMTARVNGGRAFLPVLTPDVSAATITRPGISTRVANVKVKLSAAGAAALRGAFGSPAFTTGLTIGTATVAINPREVNFTGGATELAVPAATVGVLTSLGVTPGTVGSATVTSGGAFAFPITKGRVVASSLAGVVDHTGGISLTAGSTRVELTDFRIDTRRGELWGKFNGGAPVAILKLDLSKPRLQTASGQQLWVGNVGATLTAGAAAALNGAFSVTAFTEGIDFGTATVKGVFA